MWREQELEDSASGELQHMDGWVASPWGCSHEAWKTSQSTVSVYHEAWNVVCLVPLSTVRRQGGAWGVWTVALGGDGKESGSCDNRIRHWRVQLGFWLFFRVFDLWFCLFRASIVYVEPIILRPE